jgi:hypothetical protein
MSSQYHVSELVAINGTKSRLKLRPEFESSWDHVGTKSGSCGEQVGKQVGEQVTEHVIEQISATNHRGHRDPADEITNLRIYHKFCDELTTQQMIDTICYPVGSELNTAFNPQLVHIK